jgi:HD-GYP domain-containing protein (c-di-GMP phosphodiesterase class II)
MKRLSDSRLHVAASLPIMLALLAASLFVVVAILAYNQTPSVVAQLAYLPILWAAVFFELRGSLPVAAMVAVIISFKLRHGHLSVNESWLQNGSLYLLFGVIAGALFDLRKRRMYDAEFKALQLNKVYTKMLSGLAGTLEIRDRHTQGHSERVAKNARVLGRAIGLHDNQLDILYWSGLLHDLGKIAIPESILLKEGKLNDVEYAEIKRHPTYGADLLSSIAPEFREISVAVRHHHERWDGFGYPKGLAKDDIPLLSRIISVSDVFEALTSQRPYREPASPSEALAYLRDGSGTHFDPVLIQAFEQCFHRGAIHYVPGSAFHSHKPQTRLYNPRISVSLPGKKPVVPTIKKTEVKNEVLR